MKITDSTFLILDMTCLTCIGMVYSFFGMMVKELDYRRANEQPQ